MQTGTVVLDARTGVEAELRICHLTVDMAVSRCGLVPFEPNRVHSFAECRENHQICVVCAAEWEREHGRAYPS